MTVGPGRGLKLEVLSRCHVVGPFRGDEWRIAMYCERCRKPGDDGPAGAPSPRRARASRCARCGVHLAPRPDAPADGTVGTRAQLARFGMAITGEPLLEVKRKGS